MDRHRPVFISHHLVSRLSGGDPASVGNLVLLISCPVKIFNSEILKGYIFTVIDVIEDLSGFLSVAWMYGSGAQVRDLAEYLAV